jgi:DNA-binding NarL/FixJ family response regulator
MPTPPRLRLLLADDHTLLLHAMKEILGRHFEVVAALETAEDLLLRARRNDVDVIILDISLPGMSGTEAARRLATEHSRARISFLTMHEDADMAAEAFAAGAYGYLLKNSTERELIEAIRRIGLGDRVLSKRIANGDWQALTARPSVVPDPLTPREREVVRLVARGLTMPQIGAVLGITSRTVAFHKYRAMEALGAASSAELVAHAVHLKLN